jgi:hypothetical protein
MNKTIIKLFDVVDQTELPEMSVDNIPANGDALEIKGEVYYVCENLSKQPSDPQVIGVIPLIVKNPANVSNIKEYIQCLSLAHRRVQFKNAKGNCDIESCDEMIIT